MTGVQADELDKLIRNLNSDVSDLNSELPILNDIISMIADIFKENNLNNVSDNLMTLYNCQENIVKTLKTYIDILSKVSMSYRKQEEIVSISLQIVTKK